MEDLNKKEVCRGKKPSNSEDVASNLFSYLLDPNDIGTQINGGKNRQ